MITEVGLYEKYKDFFWERDSEKIECDSGWFKVIDLMCSKLKLLDSKKKPRLESIKQRYGSMIIKFKKTGDDAFDIMMSRIAFAFSQEAAVVCEVCGESGSMSQSESKAKKILCDTHMRQMNYSR